MRFGPLCFIGKKQVHLACAFTLGITTSYIENKCSFRHFQATIHEEFLDFARISDLTGKKLAESILGVLSESGLDLNFLVGQGYDGAATMAGKIKGVQV